METVGVAIRWGCMGKFLIIGFKSRLASNKTSNGNAGYDGANEAFDKVLGAAQGDQDHIVRFNL